LELAFRALDLKPTDEIIVPANTYIASAFGGLASGAKIVPVDCAPDGTLSLPHVYEACTPNTRVVLVVHLYGDCCNMEELATFCKERQLYLVEDCAQCLGSSYKGIKLGAWGTMSCHSFYPSKNLGALGDAGAVLTHNAELAKRCRLLRNLGVSAKYIHDIKATNGRMDTLQAAFLLRKLPDMDRVIVQKREVASLYTEQLDDLHIRSRDPNVYHTYHIFAVQVGEKRDMIMKELAEAGIETLIHYPYPFYKTKAFEEYNHMTFPNTEHLAKTMLSLPMFATLRHSQLDYVATTLRRACENNK
jgi:dTDP-4-amino-4,6-dideoxygalactose transaminase